MRVTMMITGLEMKDMLEVVSAISLLQVRALWVLLVIQIIRTIRIGWPVLFWAQHPRSDPVGAETNIYLLGILENTTWQTELNTN
jgi:hypothetical protein